MEMAKTLYAENRETWRAWLEQNHPIEKEVWLVYYKAHTGQPCISYEESLEEALCFGWIDSIIQKIDEDKYARKFTPRTNTKKWSAVNKRLAARLIREGRMTPAGMAKIDDPSSLSEDEPVQRPQMLEIPPEIEQALRSSPVAWQNFNQMAPSQRRLYIGWITSAKRPETVQRRVQEAIGQLEQNLPLGMK